MELNYCNTLADSRQMQKNWDWHKLAAFLLSQDVPVPFFLQSKHSAKVLRITKNFIMVRIE